MKTKLKNAVFTVFHPSYWIQNRPYSSSVDKFVNSLDWSKIKIVDRYYAKVDGALLQVENHPYNSFCIGDKLPSRLTRHKLMKKIKPELDKHNNEKLQESINKIKDV